VVKDRERNAGRNRFLGCFRRPSRAPLWRRLRPYINKPSRAIRRAPRSFPSTKTGVKKEPAEEGITSLQGLTLLMPPDERYGTRRIPEDEA
jgi:hypothetical protein